MKKEKRGRDRRITDRITDRRTAVNTGKRGIVRNARGEAVAILMAAMMIGGFLLWMAMGHFHGMHGEARPAKAIAKTLTYHEGAAADADPGRSPDEAVEKGEGLR